MWTGLRPLGKQSLANDVARVQNKVALLLIDYLSCEIIIQDMWMVLWRQYLPSSFSNGHGPTLPTDCPDNSANHGGLRRRRCLD